MYLLKTLILHPAVECYPACECKEEQLILNPTCNYIAQFISKQACICSFLVQLVYPAMYIKLLVHTTFHLP